MIEHGCLKLELEYSMKTIVSISNTKKKNNQTDWFIKVEVEK